MQLKQKEAAYIVVEVYRGIPASVKLFYYKRAAEKYECNLRRRINLQDDETGIFEVLHK